MALQAEKQISRFDTGRMPRLANPCMLLFMSMAFAGGCAATNDTRLQVRGDPHGTAEFRFREILWRPAREGGVEMIGYGLIPFFNDPIRRDWDPRYPQTGYVTFRLHLAPESEGRYSITMLGPSTSLGPGDDEVLTTSAANVQIETGEHDGRIIRLTDVPTQSRNRPGMNLSFSGVITATPTSTDNFERQLRQFDLELSYRGPTTRP